jgi:hypothetical protein
MAQSALLHLKKPQLSVPKRKILRVAFSGPFIALSGWLLFDFRKILRVAPVIQLPNKRPFITVGKGISSEAAIDIKSDHKRSKQSTGNNLYILISFTLCRSDPGAIRG